MTACCQENSQMRAPGVFYEMLICLHGRQPIRKYSARRWQRVPPPSVTGNDLRLSSGPAFVAGFSFGSRAARLAGSIQQSPSKESPSKE
jgi:hypothetical protein